MVNLPVNSGEVDPNYTVSLQGKKVNLIPGGPDSLFYALAMGMSGNADDHAIVREIVVTRVLRDPKDYGLGKNKRDLKRIEAMKEVGTVPDLCLVNAFVKEFKVNVCIYEDGIGIVKFGCDDHNPTVHLQSLRGVHYNLLVPDGEDADDIIVSHIDYVRARGKVNTSASSPTKVLYSLVNDDPQTVQPKKKIICKNKRLASEIVKTAQVQKTVEAVPKEDSSTPSLHLTTEQIIDLQANDAIIFSLKRLLETEATAQEISAKLSETVKGRRFLKSVKSLRLHDGVVCAGSREVPVMPAQRLPAMVEEFHRVSGHIGRDKTVEAISRYFYSPRMSQIVAYVIRHCSVCQRFKGRAKGGAPLYRRVPKAPYSDYAVDLLELPPGRSNTRYLLVGIDTYTKFANAVPLKNKRSTTVAKALEERIFSSLVKLPETVTTDNGPEFRGRPFVNMLRKHGVEHFKTVPYSPNCNGAVERLNATLKNLLAAACEEYQTPWTDHLTRSLIIYNNTMHSQTGHTPADFFSNSASKLPIPVAEPYWKPPRKSFKPYLVGQLVARRIPPLPSRSKLAPRFDGPFVIVEADPNGIVYKIARTTGKEAHTVHFNQLKDWHGGDGAADQPAYGNEQQLYDGTRRDTTRKATTKALAAEQVLPVAAGGTDKIVSPMIGGVPISLSKLADKIAAAMYSEDADEDDEAAEDDDDNDQPSVDEIEQPSMEWEHLSDEPDDVFAEQSSVSDYATVLHVPTTSSVSEAELRRDSAPQRLTRSFSRQAVESLVKAIAANSDRESDKFPGARTSFRFRLQKGFPACVEGDFKLPPEYDLLTRCSMSDGPDLDEHLQREINSLSDQFSDEEF